MPSVAKLLASASGASVDPNFRNVTLLLHGDGSNGAQNNTFIDSSTNNFTITRNGNTTQGSFTPYGTLWSNYFNASNVSAAYNTALDISSGDFTIEFWVNSPVQGGGVRGVAFFNGSPSFGSNIGWNFVFHTDGSIIFEFYNGNSTSVSLTTATSACNGSWNHIAVSRSGSTFRLYLNGALQGTGTYSGTCNTNSSWATYVGSVAATNTGNIASSYISNVRIVKGTAVYTSAFTPPTAPLTAISGTSLLTCQSNRFRDASTNNFAITANGNTSVTPFSPFAPSTPYSAATNGGSVYLPGAVNNYLSAPNNAAFQFGTGDLTIEGWIYLTGDTITNPDGNRNATICSGIGAGGVFNDFWFNVTGNTTTTGTGLSFQVFNSGSGTVIFSTAYSFSKSTWYHVAFTRSGNNVYLFVNGSLIASTTYSGTITAGTNPLNIGYGQTGSINYRQPFFGYISNFRIVKGTAVYTAAFTPPTAPLTAITNTSLLLNGTNAAIFDSTSDNNLETVGNAQISTSVKKFGTGSMAFNGSSDWLSTPNKSEHNFGTGDFTIESWVYQVSTPGSQNFVSNYNGPSEGWGIRMVSGVPYFMWGDNVIVNGSSAISANTWTHIAVTRSGTTARLFVGGTQVASATDSTNLTGTGTLFVGRLRTATAGFLWNGYLDDLRITKGVARYTANFTPPTAAFPDQ